MLYQRRIACRALANRGHGTSIPNAWAHKACICFWQSRKNGETRELETFRLSRPQMADPLNLLLNFRKSDGSRGLPLRWSAIEAVFIGRGKYCDAQLGGKYYTTTQVVGKFASKNGGFCRRF